MPAKPDHPPVVRLHGSETRLPIAERGLVEYSVLDDKGKIVGVTRFTVTIRSEERRGG